MFAVRIRRLRGALAAAGLAWTACAGGAQAGPCKLGLLAELPVTMSRMAPLVTVRLNGTETPLVLDSGAFFSTISPGHAAELKLGLEPLPPGFMIRGVGGDFQPRLTHVKRFGLAKADIDNVEFLVGGGEVGGGAAGLLGQNVLHVGDVEYDLSAGVVRLFRPRDCGGLAFAYWTKPGQAYSAVPIETADPRSVHTETWATVNGQRIRVMLDTGAGVSGLSAAAARRIGLRTDGPGVTPAGYTRGLGRRPMRTWVAPVESFGIGDELVKNTKLRISEGDLVGVDMLLGADFFLSHRIYVANSQRRIYFTYNGGPVFDLSHRPETPPPGSAPPEAAPAAVAQGPGPGAASPPPPAAVPAPGEPKDADGFSRRGAAFAARGDYDKALADFDQAVKLAPQDARYPLQRAQARLATHQPFLAMGDLDATLRLDPRNVEARLLRAQLRLGGRDRQGAKADVDAALDGLPAADDARLRAAQLYMGVDAFDAALPQFDAWVAAHPDDSRMGAAMTGRCRARAYAHRELDKALRDCDAAVRLFPASFAPLETRGLVHLQRGELDRAVADDNAALRLQPKAALPLYGRGLAELKQGKKAEGDADVSAAVAEAPRVKERFASFGVSP